MAGHGVTCTGVIFLSCVIIFLSMAKYGQAQQHAPVITNYSAINNRVLPENFPVGGELGYITATDEDPGSKLQYFIQDQGGEYFSCDPITGRVILKKATDYELTIEIKSIVLVFDENGYSAKRDATLFINDVNDNAPYFQDNAIFRALREDAAVGSSVAYISVGDRDTVNAVITVTCGGSTELYRDGCNTFGLNVTERTNKYWRGNLVLKTPLDYEKRVSYNILLLAFDGVFTTTTEVHIEVTDVNDTPPEWDNVPPVAIDEELPNGTAVMNVTARDGDKTNSRPIRYSICSIDNSFAVNYVTGRITVNKRMDYESREHEKGVPYDVCIKASEVINSTSGELGNDPLTTSTIIVKITVLDINDNRPDFSQSNYVAYIDENIVSGANVPGLQMTVSDPDSGTFNTYNLVTRDYTDVFGIVPSNDAGSSSATLFVIDGNKIDYETGPRQYIVRVLAIQNFQDPRMFTGSATVTIYVRDINDQTPVYDQSIYYATVPETKPGGTFIIQIQATDSEAGDFGTSGIRYRLYGDNTPPNFQIDEITGIVSVAPCNLPNVPGVAPCIDFERKQNYTLTVSATDNKGLPGSRTRSVQLIIGILDENDNVPRTDSQYVGYIYEGQMVPINPIVIEPVDPDTVGGPLTFTIRGDASTLWRLSQGSYSDGRQYANITASRPIQFNDAKYPTGQFNFAVEIADQAHFTTAAVTIFVIDINDNAPQFSQSQFVESIYETTKGNVFVTKVSASDADSSATSNGQVDFSIQSGAEGKFTITNAIQVGNNFIADVYTTRDATFNYETKKEYNMILVARDRGTPESKSGTALLTVRILDVNNRDPQVQPSFQSVNVYENVPVGTTVYKVIANDPDANSILRYYMRPYQAISGAGDTVDPAVYNYSNLFRIEPETGNVVVNAKLDRDLTSRITSDLLVRDISATPIQEGNGTLLIHILEYNDQAPQFDENPYSITIDEELNINSFVLNLNCKDKDNKIASYSIIQQSPSSPRFFVFLPGSGAMIVSYRIDYEQPLDRIELIAQCTDDGQPPLSNTTRVIVNVRNINDNTPAFLQNSYQTTILENTPGGTKLNIAVSAQDLDRGDFGVVKYALNDPYGKFSIDNNTGVISILPNATFDRETQPFLSFQVVAYDSPMNATVRRSSLVPVYVTIGDINDNCPIFTQSSYEGKVPQRVNTETDIIDTLASDSDAGENAEIVYAIKKGSGVPPVAEDYFGINSVSGRIYLKSFGNKTVEFYSFNVTASDKGTIPCTSEVPVQIEIQQVDNNAPVWIRPPNRNSVICVLESQYEGMLVYAAKAVDNDPGLNGVVDYFFTVEVNGQGAEVSSTGDFEINRITGVITAEPVFDRETRDSYFLTLMARDRGNPASSSETTIIVCILDVNDNEPVFITRDGVVVPLVLPVVPEDVEPGNNYRLGQCQATDADSDVENNRIYYEIIAARDEVRNYIFVNRTTCEIFLTKKPDFETMPVIEFDIYAFNEKNDDYVRREKREVNPSILPVRVVVGDVNDNAPYFSQQSYLACVSIDAPFQQNILEVSAMDKDVDDNTRITYSLENTNAFHIDRDLGIISNIVSFRQSGSQSTYNFNVVASDGKNSGRAQVTIFVTSQSTTARLKINRPLNDVLPFRQQIIRTLVDTSNKEIAFACVNDMKAAVDNSGLESSTATDVLVSAFRLENGQYVPYSSSGLVSYVDGQIQRGNTAFEALYVTSSEEEGQADKFILDEDAVIAVMIICILLIFLAILLLIVCCICISNSDRKKKRKLQTTSHGVAHVEQPVETSFNPVYGTPSMHDDDTYSTVRKVPLGSGHISPVVIAAPLGSDDPDGEPPEEPPRLYMNEPEPVIVTEVDSGPRFDTFLGPEPVIVTEVEPDPYIVTEVEPDPYFETEVEPGPDPGYEPVPMIETEIEPEPAHVPIHVTHQHFEPEFEDRRDSDVSDRSEPEGHHRVAFPDPPNDDYLVPVPRADYDEDDGIARDSPHSSPPGSLIHERPEYDSD